MCEQVLFQSRVRFPGRSKDNTTSALEPPCTPCQGLWSDFQLQFPKTLAAIDPAVLDPSQAWADSSAYRAMCEKLSAMYASNFAKYEADPFMAALRNHGPEGAALVASSRRNEREIDTACAHAVRAQNKAVEPQCSCLICVCVRESVCKHLRS